MRAMGVPFAGALDKLGPVEIEPPAVGAGQVAVRVIAAALNPADTKVMSGELAGRALHGRSKPLVTGYDFSGIVEARGDGVTDLTDGAEVFGFLAYASKNKQGSFAERIAIDRAAVARKPPAISHATAAASATPGLTALQSFRDKARLKSGGRVLVIGAAGGVGSVAIGVARALGAHVTGVCSTYAVELVRELGADDVVDRRERDPRSLTGPFDAVLDAAAAYSYASTRHMLAPDGAYVTTLPSAGWIGGKLMTLASKRHCHLVVVKSVAADLELLAGWMAGDAKLRVPIDATFPIRDLAKAIDRFAKGELRGRIAIDVDGGWNVERAQTYVWDRDGLFVGGLFDHPKVDGTPEFMYHLGGELAHGTLYTGPDGDVIFAGNWESEVRLYRITGWGTPSAPWLRQSGSVTPPRRTDPPR